jgi:guanosine-3',5'-bis(diphosphate) 3'-pyrophosphohydrolase
MLKIRTKDELSAPSTFALERHGRQRHGSLKIEDHLRDVVGTVRKHYDPHVNISELGEVASAAWLHDVCEDTPTTSDEIAERFGDRVGDLVELLTDKEGKNRVERHLRTYPMIRRDPDAILIKLADRRHNQARSIEHGERWALMYYREYLYFKFALYNPGQFVLLWKELDEQYKQLEDILTW